MIKREDVPDELVNLAIMATWEYNPDGSREEMASFLAAVLPAHEAMVRAKVAAEIEELRVRLLNRPSSQRPDAVDAVWEAREITRGGE